MLPSPTLITLVTIFSLLLLLPPSQSGGLDDFIKCRSSGSFDCGILRNVSYPFWKDNTPKNCRPPGFQLDCSEPSPIIDIGEKEQFRLLQVNQTSYTMTLGPKDPREYVCPREPQSRTLLHPYLKFSKINQNLQLLYNCTLAQATQPPENTIKSCQSKNNIDPILANNSVVQRNDFRELFAPGTTFEIEVNQTVYQKLQNLRLVEALSGGFDVVYNFSAVLCGQCESFGGFCKFNPSSARDSSCQGRPFLVRHIKLIIAIATPGTGVLLAFIIAIVFRKKAVGIFRKNAMGILRKRKGIFSRVTKPDQAIEAFIRNYGSLAPKRYSFSHVKKITNSYKEKLGKGGYGDVYKGKLPDGRLVAVKVLNGSKENGEEFINEVASISRTSHVNIVSLLGFCLEGEKRALIYEFMPNGSLEKFVFNESTSEESRHLGWEKMYSIAVGIARGLEYLHRGCNIRIIHLDIKPHNILLDEEFCPKISDFGLSKLCTRKDSIVSMMGPRGTAGYIAPEVFSRNFGAVSHKSDIYSYGMMILEMVGGKKSIQMAVNVSSEYFPDWVYKRLELVDEHELQGLRSDAETDIEKKMILVGLWCIQTKPSDRPSINKVIEMLEGSVEALSIPPKPLLSSPPRPELPVPNSGTGTTSSCECPSVD